MSRPVFGQLAPCRTCHGSGEVKHAAPSKEEKAARDRATARARRLGTGIMALPSMDPCPGCAGKGYVTPKVADAPVQMYEGMD